MNELSNIIVFMKVGMFGEEKLPEIMTRVKAEYEKEKEHNPEAYYPFGYETHFGDGYTAQKLRGLIARELGVSVDGVHESEGIDLVFSPVVSRIRERNMTDYDLWRECCHSGIFPSYHDLGPKEGSWRYMDLPVKETKLLPEHYLLIGGHKAYYGLVFQDLELCTNPICLPYVDLSLFRRIDEDSKKDGSILDGKQWLECPIPCVRVHQPANVFRMEPVIAKAKLINPYAVELRPIPF